MSTRKHIAELKARLEAMANKEIGGADARQFYQWDLARCIRIIEVYEAALKSIEKSDSFYSTRQCDVATDALSKADAIAAGEGEK